MIRLYKTSVLLLIFYVALFTTAKGQQKDFYNWAKTPPMGWNSYNCYGSAVHEDEVKANTDYMAKYLKPHGWEYIVIDYLWSFDSPPGSRMGNALQKRASDGFYLPWLSMDKWGRLLPHVNKFPSAFTGKGFKPLADYIHKKGLKFGIHVMRGIPRQAVFIKSPVLGTEGITADQIADTTSMCDWVNHMYGLNMSAPGAQAYLNSLLNLYASWGVDFIKVDDIARPYSAPEIEGYSKAIAQCGRPIVLSLSPGQTPVKQAGHVKNYANQWRIAEDFWDNWGEVLRMFDYAKSWEGKGGIGYWPDCDMLQIGKLSKRGPEGPERYSRLTDDELYTHMTFWALYRSPLMIGGNMPENRALELKLFTNDEVIAVNQKGKDPQQLYKKDAAMVWYSQTPDHKAKYVALFNIGDLTDPVKISVQLKELGIEGNCIVRDLWAGKDLGTFSLEFNALINKHGAGLYKITPTPQ